MQKMKQLRFFSQKVQPPLPKMSKAVIRDTERGEELTLTTLREEYETLKTAGETEAETFEDYLENITDGNGTCEWI